MEKDSASKREKVTQCPSAPSAPSLVGEAMRRVGEAAQSFEGRWTYAALRRVDPELANLFAEQDRDYGAALVTGSESDIEEQVGAMVRGYQAITRRMVEANAPDDAYMLGKANGWTVAIGEQKAAIARVRDLHGEKVVWITPDEVAALVGGMQGLAQVKEVWPDAEIIQLYPGEAAKAG